MFDPLFPLAFFIIVTGIISGGTFWVAKKYLPPRSAKMVAWGASLGWWTGYLAWGAVLKFDPIFWLYLPPLARVSLVVGSAIIVAVIAVWGTVRWELRSK